MTTRVNNNHRIRANHNPARRVDRHRLVPVSVSVVADRGICLIKLLPRLAIVDGEQAWKMRSDGHDEPQS